MSMNKVLVTGATGHIGSTLCRALVDEGKEVVAFVRPTSKRDALLGVPVRYAVGDVLDDEALAEAASGCDVIFHNAAIFEVHASDPDALRRVSVEGARSVVRAAALRGARLVFTSSAAAVGAAEHAGTVLDESTWAKGLSVPYFRAKQAAERAALRLAEDLDVHLVRVLPTLVLGPHDHRITPSSRVLLDMLHGTGASFEGGLNVIDVRDAAQAMIVAARRGRAGGRYLLGGENVSFRELGAIVGRLTGRPIRHVALPRWAMSCIAGVAEVGGTLTGAAPALTRALVHDAYGRFAWYDVSRARTELDLTPRPVEDTVRDAAAFFAAAGVVRSRGPELGAPAAEVA